MRNFIKKLKVEYLLGMILLALFVVPTSLNAQDNSKNTDATWIWYPGDYEIWLSNQMQAKRTERGAFFPPLWRYYSPYSLVTFRKKLSLDQNDVVEIHTEGQAKIQLDGKMYYGDPKALEIPAGDHILTIKVYNQEATPSLFVKGNNVITDASWEVTYEDKEWIDASGRTSGESGTHWDQVGSWDFDNKEDLPSEFRLETKPKKAVKITPHKKGYLVDFGEETFGFVKLHGLEGSGDLNVYYGESEEEARSEEFCETLDRLEFDGSQASDFLIDQSRAFRYVNVQPEDGIELDSVSMLYEYLPLEYKGAFNSSDELLNEIWDVSAYTMHLTSREFFIDGIKRDRWIWSGDAYQSYLMNYYLFNDNPSVKRTTYALRGKDPVNSHINTIMDYSFYWFMGIYDYYLFSGDEDFIKQIYPRMKSLMEFCLERRNANGMVEGLPGDWVFIDWADGLSKEGEVSFEQLLFARSLETMAICAEINGEPDAVKRYNGLAEDLKQKIQTEFWSDEQQAFIHNRVEGELTDKVTRYTNMFAIFFDYVNAEKEAQIKEHVLLNDQVQQITTPYMRFYELEALCALGEQEYVLDEIRDYWGGMLELGATSFWEKYDPTEKGVEQLAMYGRPFGKSLCHAWGASPIYLFGRYYLGVQPTAPGYASYEIRPNLGGLKWMEGKVPTPKGPISVYADRREIKINGIKGAGKLIFKSRNTPSGAAGIQSLGDDAYELAIETDREYKIKYKAL